MKLTLGQSDWPTFPQLYLKGELVGGLDIVSAIDAFAPRPLRRLQVKEELDSNPDFFSEFQVAPKGQGGMSAPAVPGQSIST